jgi:uncharacterized protein with ParB-like and HNH nuclease domain
MEKIAAQTLSVRGIFQNFYLVPDYQREYVWEEKQVTQLLNDISEEFDEAGTPEYFIGTIVVSMGQNNKYEVIDGQQRLTTLFLILNAFRTLLKERTDEDMQALKQMLFSQNVDSGGNFVNDYRLVLQYEQTTGLLDAITEDKEPESMGASGARINNAYKQARSFLDTNYQSLDDLKKFMGFFLNSVKIIQIETPRVSDALKIFETINERGVGLNPMDLLKNLLFRQIKPEEFQRLKSTWKEMVDALDGEGEKPLRFLRYFIMANYEVKNPRGESVIREDELYDWLVEHKEECGYEREPFKFAQLLLENAKAYVHFLNGRDTDGNPNLSLGNISRLSGSSRQQLILFLAARKMSKDLFTHLARQIETLLFYYIVTRTQSKEYERKFSIWAKELLTIQSKEQLNTFITNYIQIDVDKRRKEFDQWFSTISLSSLQKYRIQYILAKVAAYIEQQFRGVREEIPIDEYVKGYEVEHILPNTPEADLRESFGIGYDDEKVKLGNLTLLEKPINIVASNGYFDEKKKAYTNASLHLTKSIGNHVQVGKNTSADRIYAKLKTFDIWDANAIHSRQDMLRKLADDVWSVSAMQ